MAASARPFGALQLAATAVAVLALLRGAIFIHEIAHLRRRALPGFEIAWHLLIGLPFMLPALMYGAHAEHHRSAVFGTPLDPEYAPLARWSRLRIAVFVLSVAVVPPLLAIRWGLLGPLSWLAPPLRRLLIRSASTLVINPGYQRPLPQGPEARRWAAQELAAAATAWAAAVAVWQGLVPPWWLLEWWAVSAGILIVNQVRTLAAHRYANDEGAPVSDLGQLLDSINLPGGRVLTLLAAPLGMRFHALHHFLPTVPYHALGALHRALVRELPAGAPYRTTERSGILSAVASLLRPGPPGGDGGDASRELDLSADRARGGAS